MGVDRKVTKALQGRSAKSAGVARTLRVVLLDVLLALLK
jgi:hypothetical protein